MRLPLALALLAALPGHALAQDRFMPTASCTQVAGFEDPAEHQAMERYLRYALSTLLKTNLPDDAETYAELRRRTGAVCVDMPHGTTLEAAVASLADSLQNPHGPIEAEARELLGKFLISFANRPALTQMLKPTPEEIAAIFKPEIVPGIMAYVDQIYDGAVIGPKDGQTELLIVPATTTELIEGAPVLAEFPGGYKALRPYLNPGIPVIRFKFVKPGDSLGMAFDGLYKVGDRWVMIPKAWRVVTE